MLTYSLSDAQVTSPAEQSSGAKVVFSVPTGNFGNVLAGYYAQQMGLPIHHFVVATNQNEYIFVCMHRFIVTDDGPVPVYFIVSLIRASTRRSWLCPVLAHLWTYRVRGQCRFFSPYSAYRHLQYRAILSDSSMRYQIETPRA